MKIIIDTNILISTLMRSNGTVGTFLLKSLQGYEMLSPYTLYVELFDKKEKILRFTKIPEIEFLELLYIVLKRIDFINEHQISEESWRLATDLTNGIDEKDTSFVALTIETGGILWTGDKKLFKGLQQKGFDRVVNLDQLKDMVLDG